MMIHFSQINADSLNNARRSLTGIAELAESIKQNGLLQSLVVEPDEKREDKYTLRAGFRRFAALQTLGHESAECTVVPPGRGDIVNLVENLSREDLTNYDYAMGLAKLSGQGLSAAKIAKVLVNTRAAHNGASVSNINNLLRLVRDLHPQILTHWENGEALATVPNLLVIVKAKDQLHAWNVMIGATPGEEEEYGEDEDGEESESESKPKARRRSPAHIAKMLEFVTESHKNGNVTKETYQAVKSCFAWTLGNQKTLCGISLDE